LKKNWKYVKAFLVQIMTIMKKLFLSSPFFFYIKSNIAEKKAKMFEFYK